MFLKLFERNLVKNFFFFFFSYASRASSLCKSRYWSCTGTMGLPALSGYVNACREVRCIEEGEKSFEEERGKVEQRLD